MSDATPSTDPLTIVLVHGAFADASSWSAVVEHLQARKIEVAAPPNPLRGISIDSAYIASFFQQIPGPVLAVGQHDDHVLRRNALAVGADRVLAYRRAAKRFRETAESVWALSEQGRLTELEHSITEDKAFTWLLSQSTVVEAKS